MSEKFEESEEINLKRLSIIFLIGLCFLVGIFFLTNNSGTSIISALGMSITDAHNVPLEDSIFLYSGPIGVIKEEDIISDFDKNEENFYKVWSGPQSSFNATLSPESYYGDGSIELKYYDQNAKNPPETFGALRIEFKKEFIDYSFINILIKTDKVALQFETIFEDKLDNLWYAPQIVLPENKWSLFRIPLEEFKKTTGRDLKSENVNTISLTFNKNGDQANQELNCIMYIDRIYFSK